MRKVQLVVTFLDNTIGYFGVDIQGGWKVDTSTRELKLGKGFPRTNIPLDNVRYYAIEEYESAD